MLYVSALAGNMLRNLTTSRTVMQIFTGRVPRANSRLIRPNRFVITWYEKLGEYKQITLIIYKRMNLVFKEVNYITLVKDFRFIIKSD